MAGALTDLHVVLGFFPGLGWMIERDMWLELGPKWPDRSVLALLLSGRSLAFDDDDDDDDFYIALHSSVHFLRFCHM